MKRVACHLLFATTLTANPLCAIRGIVVDALTNQPLPRTQVFADMHSDSDDDSAPAVRQITDSYGAFCFETLTTGKYGIRATRAFYIDAITANVGRAILARSYRLPLASRQLRSRSR